MVVLRLVEDRASVRRRTSLDRNEFPRLWSHGPPPRYVDDGWVLAKQSDSFGRTNILVAQNSQVRRWLVAVFCRITRTSPNLMTRANQDQ